MSTAIGGVCYRQFCGYFGFVRQVKTKLLSSPSPSPSAGDGGVQDSKDGVFALYNYARLSTLLSNFEKAVLAGKCVVREIIVTACTCVSAV